MRGPGVRPGPGIVGQGCGDRDGPGQGYLVCETCGQAGLEMVSHSLARAGTNGPRGWNGGMSRVGGVLGADSDIGVPGVPSGAAFAN